MTTFSNCPDCSAHLHGDRTTCRCGWKAPSVQQQDRDPNHVPCADNPNCRKPGRLWFEGMAHNERVCIYHSYDRYDRGERDAAL